MSELGRHEVESECGPDADCTSPCFSHLTMAPRRRAVVTEESIDQQLQQIHLLDPQSTTENLEQLGPIIQQIHQNRQQDAYTRTLKRL
jgi:hypothetical protein